MKKMIEFRNSTGESGSLRLLLGRKMKLMKKSLSANNTFNTAPSHRVTVKVFLGSTKTVDSDTQTPALFLKKITLSTDLVLAVTCSFIIQTTQATNIRT